MLFPHNGSDDDQPGSDPAAEWGAWLRTTADEPASSDPRPAAQPQVPAADSAWSQWLGKPDPATESGPGDELGTDDEPAAAAPGDTGRRTRRLLAVACGGLVLAVGAVIAGSVVVLSTTAKTPAPAITTPSASATAPHPDPVLGGGPGCDPVRGPNLVRGNGTGGTGSGPDTILAFQHAYYSARSGATAWAVVAPGAQVPPVAAIDAGIATVPADARYCVTITPAAADEYMVVIAETRQDSSVRTYVQQVTVTAQDGRTLITRIGHVQ